MYIGSVARRRVVRLSDNFTLGNPAGKALYPFKALAAPKRKGISNLTNGPKAIRASPSQRDSAVAGSVVLSQGTTHTGRSDIQRSGLGGSIPPRPTNYAGK